MKSLIFTVFVVFVAAVVLQLLGLSFAIRLKFMELLGVGVIMAKFSYDYYKNRKESSSYTKYAIYSGLAFLIFNGALFSFSKLPVPISLSLLLLSLLAFSMIGVNDSLKKLKPNKNEIVPKIVYFYIGIFAVHGLYAFAMASSLLKGYDLNFLVPAILIIDGLIVLPFIIIKKAYDQHILTALFVISISINTQILAAVQNLGTGTN